MGEQQRKRKRKGDSVNSSDSVSGGRGRESVADALRIFAPFSDAGSDGSGSDSGSATDEDAITSQEADGNSDKATLRSLKQIDVVAFNGLAEERFVSFLTSLIMLAGSITVIDALRESAFELDISTETAKRYLLKHTARRARFCIENGLVKLRVREVGDV